ncbi:MAG: hypothetical protein Q4E42_06450 [Phascolarctobacterium sp.]|nr:hypothetical protein [Phascolarctobacterium sp.]
MNFVTQIYLLSQKFLDDYPNDKYPELMNKQGRPYSCLLIDLHEEYFICIPFRSHINHKNAYMFTKSKRSKQTHSGLDYSKVVLIKKSAYFSNKNAIVDQDEYSETMTNIKRIVSEIVTYIDGYTGYVKGNITLHKREFERLYKYSTLKYFHDILGL